MPHFPNYFLWGRSTTASHIAGTWHNVGNGESFWNNIANTLATIRPKHNGQLANDRYHLDRSKQISIHGYVCMIKSFRLLTRGIQAQGPNLIHEGHEAARNWDQGLYLTTKSTKQHEVQTIGRYQTQRSSSSSRLITYVLCSMFYVLFTAPKSRQTSMVQQLKHRIRQ